MADRKFTIPDGDELIITVPGKKPSGDSSAKLARRKGLIPPKRAHEILPRRLQKNGINFYDLGQFKDENGAWIDNDYTVVPGLALTNFHPDPVFSDPEAVVAALNAALLGAGAPHLASRYRKISPSRGQIFGLRIIGRYLNGEYWAEILNEQNPNFTEEGGLRLTPEQLQSDLFEIFCEPAAGDFPQSALFWGLRTAESSVGLGYRVTASFDADAPPVNYRPTNSDTFFLCPLTVYPNIQFQVHYVNETTTFWRGGLLYRFFPRRILLDPDFEFYNLHKDAEWNREPSVSIYTSAHRTAMWMKSLSGARLVKQTSNGNAWTFDTLLNWFPPAYPSPPQLPAPPVRPPVADYANSFFNRTPGSVVAAGQPAAQNHLRAVIRQGGAYFYVWNRY